jgi:poly(A) polymerase
MLGSGRSRVIFEGLIRYRLLPWILPAIASAASSASWRSAFLDRLSALDDSVSAMEEKRLGRQLPFVLSLPLSSAVDWKAPPQDAYHQALAAARDAFHPMNLPRVELELAVRQVFRERGIPLLQKHLEPRDADGKPARPRRRRRGPRGSQEGPKGAGSDSAPKP